MMKMYTMLEDKVLWQKQRPSISGRREIRILDTVSQPPS